MVCINRADHFYTACEVKYLNAPVPVSVGTELKQKIEQVKEFVGKTVQRVIVSNQSASLVLKDSGLIGRVVSVEEF